LQHDEETALCAAVLAAYSHDELEMLLYQHCGGIRLDVIAPPAANFEVIVFKVVAAARTGGWLVTFIEAVIARRPGNAGLRAWASRYHGDVLAGAPTARDSAEPVPTQLLMDPAHFDLTEIRHAIRTALQGPASPVVGFGVRYPESLFVQKLLDWLHFYLDGETQSKATLSLMPEIAPLDYCLRQLRSYQPDLAEVNVLCEIAVRGVAADVIQEFWNGVRTEFDRIARNLVLVLTGDPGSDFPDGVIALPQPRFSRSDVADWTERLISQRGWPGSVAQGWTEWLCTAASIRDEHLDVRLLYEAMDRSVTVFRREPEKFRAMHEKRS
jgi:hypothetical protein